MGNNSAFSNFEDVVHAVYKHGVLTLPLLRDLAKAFRDQDADWGGYSGKLSKDKLDLVDIVIKTSGKPVPVKPNLPKLYRKWTDEQRAENERWHEKRDQLFNKIVKLDTY